MNPVQLILLSLVVGVAAGALVALGAAPFVPLARALRAGLAGVIGGTVGFAMTALVQGPFYSHARTLSELAEPMGISALAAAGAAALCATMILRARRKQDNSKS